MQNPLDRVRPIDEPDGGPRIAWAYLTSVLAMAGGLLIVSIFSPLVSMTCEAAADPYCGLAATILLAFAAHVLALVGFAIWARLKLYFVLAYVSLFLGLAMWLNSAILSWGGLLVVLIPLIAAVATAPRGRDELPRAHKITVLAVTAVTLGAFVWWIAA